MIKSAKTKRTYDKCNNLSAPSIGNRKMSYWTHAECMHDRVRKKQPEVVSIYRLSERTIKVFVIKQ